MKIYPKAVLRPNGDGTADIKVFSNGMLAFSAPKVTLHQADDELKDGLVPITLSPRCAHFDGRHGHRVCGDCGEEVDCPPDLV